MTTVIVQRELGRLLNDRYGQNDVDILAFDLGISDIASNKSPKNEKVIALVSHMTRRGRLLDLVTHIAATRPDLNEECNRLRQMLGSDPIESPPPPAPAEAPMTPDESDLYALVDKLERELNEARKTVLQIKARL